MLRAVRREVPPIYEEMLRGFVLRGWAEEHHLGRQDGEGRSERTRRPAQTGDGMSLTEVIVPAIIAVAALWLARLLAGGFGAPKDRNHNPNRNSNMPFLA